MKAVILSMILFLSFGNQLASQQTILPNGNDSMLLLKSQKIQKVIIKFPVNFDKNKEYPLLLVLHGNGGTPQGIIPDFQLFYTQDVILAFPEGQYPKIVNGTIGYSWYLETEDKNIWEFADQYCVENIDGLIKELNSNYTISKNYVFGFSQGASLAYMAGFKYPESISGIIAVGGELPSINRKGAIISSENIVNAKNLKVLVARGSKDKLISKKEFEIQRKFFEKNGYKAFSFEYDGEHYLTKELLYKVFDWINKN
jgi:phospholipase/carboxylesterase